jgi:hypothetical protein
MGKTKQSGPGPDQAPDAQVLATMSDTATVHAAGRGKPYINFGDGHDLQTGYSATSNGSNALQNATPLAMASADFDEDGVPDLISGYSVEGAGLVVAHRGNIDSIYPNAPEAQHQLTGGVSKEGRPYRLAITADVPRAP